MELSHVSVFHVKALVETMFFEPFISNLCHAFVERSGSINTLWCDSDFVHHQNDRCFREVLYTPWRKCLLKLFDQALEANLSLSN